MSFSKSFEGTTALVTGASKRLGRAISLALARRGADIALHYRESEEEAASLRAEIEGLGRRSVTVQADLGERAGLEAFFERVVEAAGPVDILVNNASIFPEDTLCDATYEAFEANFRINAWAPFVLTRALAGQGRPGAVVNLLDARIHDYDRKHVSYHLSKRDLFTYTRMAALEFAPVIRVNAVAPGLVLPPPGESEAYLESLRDTNPLAAIGTPEQIASATLFLIENEFVTGQVIYVDGGRHMLGGVYG